MKYILFFLLFSFNCYAQKITVKGGLLAYHGYLDQTLNASNGGNNTFSVGYNHNLTKTFSLGLEYSQGSFAFNDISILNNQNFKTGIMAGAFNLVYSPLFKEAKAISPFLGVSIGYLLYSSATDLKDASGNTYYYYKDGMIRDKPDNGKNDKSGTVLTKDYEYETPLSNGSAFYLPLTIGTLFHLTPHFATSLSYQYALAFSSQIDNTGNLARFSYLAAGIQFSFKPEEKRRYAFKNYNRRDKSLDYLMDLDSDKDGVSDIKDKSPGTPIGVKVDKNGVPLDSDKDGVPDYADKEIHSKKKLPVDSDGVGITEEKFKELNKQLKRAVQRDGTYDYEKEDADMKKALEDEKEQNKKDIK